MAFAEHVQYKNVHFTKRWESTVVFHYHHEPLFHQITLLLCSDPLDTSNHWLLVSGGYKSDALSVLAQIVHHRIKSLVASEGCMSTRMETFQSNPPLCEGEVPPNRYMS